MRRVSGFSATPTEDRRVRVQTRGKRCPFAGRGSRRLTSGFVPTSLYEQNLLQ